MDLNQAISDAAFEFGRTGGMTTAGALQAISENPSQLDLLIDGAADPRRAELVEVRAELQKRLEVRQAERKSTPPTPAAATEAPPAADATLGPATIADLGPEDSVETVDPKPARGRKKAS